MGGTQPEPSTGDQSALFLLTFCSHVRRRWREDFMIMTATIADRRPVESFAVNGETRTVSDASDVFEVSNELLLIVETEAHLLLIL